MNSNEKIYGWISGAGNVLCHSGNIVMCDAELGTNMELGYSIVFSDGVPSINGKWKVPTTESEFWGALAELYAREVQTMDALENLAEVLVEDRHVFYMNFVNETARAWHIDEGLLIDYEGWPLLMEDWDAITEVFKDYIRSGIQYVPYMYLYPLKKVQV